MADTDPAVNTPSPKPRRGLPFGKGGDRSPEDLQTLIRVFAGFSKVDGEIQEDDLDSALGFLRYDYTEAVYSELQEIFRQALRESQDLNLIAQQLSGQLSLEEKILLGVQLYILISRSAGHREQLVSFYLFMTNLGVASEAIDIVYQLNADQAEPMAADDEIPSPLEAIHVSAGKPGDLLLRSMEADAGLMAFRFQDLLMVKNIGTRRISARGRSVGPGEFCRLYDGQRVILDDTVLTYSDLVFYLNAKKDVSSTVLFASIVEGQPTSIRIERRRSRQSDLQLRFGLGASITALRETSATIGEKALPLGEEIEVALDDEIQIEGGAAIPLLDLRRRAREFGGQFELELHRPDYLVSNNPDKLRPGDILLSQGLGGDILLRIECDYSNKRGTLKVIDSHRPVFVGGELVRGETRLQDGDSIALGPGQFLVCDFSEGIIEEQRTVIRSIELDQVDHTFGRSQQVLEGISFKANRGDLICVMGPSGCGKSTLLRLMAGQLKPSHGNVLLNDASLYEHRETLSPFLAFMPQDDAYDPLLKVGENLRTAAAIRCPHLPLSERKKRTEAKLLELGLYQQRDRLAGSAESKLLSGGERKRLNVGLDMIAISDVFLFDEPTSGLSSKDSEHVLEIIRGLAHNKIVFVSIHQPSARLFQMFDQALLLDQGGRMVFCGPPDDMLGYFTTSVREQATPDNGPGAGMEPNVEQPPLTQPEEIFDVLETPLRDPGGDILYERNSQGHLVPARRYTPEFWRDRFEAHRLMSEVSHPPDVAPHPDIQGADASIPTPPPRTLKDELVVLWTLIRRSFLSKLRNRGNLATTLLEAPGLALLIGTVLRYSEDGTYTMASAFHIPTYLFLSLVVAMFLGLTNSADDIIRDRPTLIRERNHRVRRSYYIASKILSLAFFALIQCGVYLLIGNAILEIRSMFWIFLLWMFLTSLIGVCLGLLISSLVNDPKTALNSIPLILIPQIILGGALIKYEEMNRDLDFVHSIRQWLQPEEDSDIIAPPSRLRVPFICQFMPLRWSYEALVVSQASLNPRSRYMNELGKQKDLLRDIPIDERTETQSEELGNTLQALAFVYGMQGENGSDISRKLSELMAAHRKGEFDPYDEAWQQDGKELLTAEELFDNKKIRSLVDKAEIERADYRLGEQTPNVFLGPEKKFLGLTIDTLLLDLVVLLTFVALSIAALRFSLTRQLDRV